MKFIEFENSMCPAHDLPVRSNALAYIKLFFIDKLMESITVNTNKYGEYNMKILKNGWNKCTMKM